MRWYSLLHGISCLLITKMFLFWIFWRWKIWYFWAKKLMEIWYLLITEKFLFWTFRWWEIRPFFHPKSWWKDDIYLVFLSFPWYSRTWEIWFFAPWLKILSLQIHKCTPFLTIFKVFVKCFSVLILLVAS